MATQVILCDIVQPDQFKYAKLPLYQAFLSYKNMDRDSKKNITAEAGRRNAALSDDVVESIKGCRDTLTDEFIKEQLAMAETFPEVSEDARRFMRVLMQELNRTIDTLKVWGLI